MLVWVRALVWVRVFDLDRPSKARLPLAVPVLGNGAVLITKQYPL
jgi:hypothetical protein